MAAVAVLSVTLCVSLAVLVNGHGAVVNPPPRNAIDHDEAPWSGGVPTPIPFEPFCPFPQDAKTLSATNGQSCFWFSNGAGIGCAQPDGNTRGPIPNQPAARKKMDPCGKNFTATICDPKQRTVNTGAECGAADDWYYYSPWRAPGSAGVFDSCGMAGGRTAPGGFGAVYQNTTHAKQGDLGSKLAPRPTGTVWKAGSVVEVSWALQANHGGGYSYRLCPADSPLTEECFFKTPLDFVGRQSLRWHGVNGTQIWIDEPYINKGTFPPGSMWAKNPIPRNDIHQTGQGFAPPCEESPDCVPTGKDDSCFCSGMWGPYNLEIIDTVQIPATLKPGNYVLGWRWDCEESNQIWASCSDVTISEQ